MGMRVNTGSGIDPKMIEQLIEIERQPIKRIEQRKTKVEEEQKSFLELKGLISTLGSSLNSFRNRSDFYKLKLESSHPDIIDGTVSNNAPIGNYEVEIRRLARTHKLLADNYPDKDKTPVGFGYMSIELDDGRVFDVDIDPDKSTLQDVANAINEANAGARAIIIKTKEGIEIEGEEYYRLLVISETSGKNGKIFIDPDSTYLEFKEQVTGRNLDMLFEDVHVYNETNTINDFIDGVVLNAKRAEPGTKVTIKVDVDIDKTMEEIKKLVENYNKVNEFLEKQFKLDPETNHSGNLSKDNSLKTLRRSFQTSLQVMLGRGKYRSLGEVGIISDSKTGALKMDDAKVKQALSDDYESVANLFIQSDQGAGVGARMSDAVRAVQNQQFGVLASKEREYRKVMDGFDTDIATKERMVNQRAEGIKRKFSALETLLNGLNSQGQFLQQRLGGADSGGK